MIKPKLYSTYMQMAELYAQLSYCERLKVGAVVVTSSGACFGGFNGTLPGFPNVCEQDGVTSPFVCHAEENALYKMLKEGVSAESSTLFTTCSPCTTCARMLISSGVRHVVWKDYYRDTSGLELLHMAGVTTEQYNNETNQCTQLSYLP